MAGATANRRQPRVGDDRENGRVERWAREDAAKREGDRSDFPISAADCICISAQATGSVPTIAHLISNCIRPDGIHLYRTLILTNSGD